MEHQTEALDALIARVQYAIDNDLALSVEDMELLLHAILTLCTLQEKMEQQDITLTKLRKLLGIVKQSERRSDENLNDDKQKSAAKKNKRSKNKKRTPDGVSLMFNLNGKFIHCRIINRLCFRKTQF